MPAGAGERYELIAGELITMAPAGGMHGYLAQDLTGRVQHFVQTHRLGVVVAAETGFILSRNPDTVRAPDGAFIRRERISQKGIPRGFFEEAPALVIEVVSPSDTVSEVSEKMQAWLAAGVELAWVVEPRGRTVTIYRTTGEIQVLTVKDILSGESVLPGFECRLAELFELV